MPDILQEFEGQRDVENHRFTAKLKFDFSQTALLEKIGAMHQLNENLRTLLAQVDRNALAAETSCSKASSQPPLLLKRTIKDIAVIRNLSQNLYDITRRSYSEHESHLAYLNLQPHVTDTEGQQIFFQIYFKRPESQSKNSVNKSTLFSVHSSFQDGRESRGLILRGLQSSPKAKRSSEYCDNLKNLSQFRTSTDPTSLSLKGGERRDLMPRTTQNSQILEVPTRSVEFSPPDIGRLQNLCLLS